LKTAGLEKLWEAGQSLEKAILTLKTDLVIIGSTPKYSIEYGGMARFIMLDGLTLHCSSSELFQIVKKKEMIILILPSHTKAVLQPFGRENVGLFKISL
jgi:hypothetical protein